MTEERPRRAQRLSASEQQELTCSFCGRPKREVARLFISSRGPHYLCDACVGEFASLLREEQAARR